MRGRVVWFCTIGVAGAALSTACPSFAQLSPSRSGTSDAPRSASEDEYWFFLRELGRCLAASKPAQSVALLSTRIDSPDEKRAFSALFNRQGNNVCMRNMVRASVVPAVVRGVIAENLYKTRVATLPQLAVQRLSAGPPAIVTIHDFADCYIVGNHGAARGLMTDTKLGTEGETDRVSELSATFLPCFPPGRQIRVVPTNIRLALAGALYRAAVAQPVAQRPN